MKKTLKAELVSLAHKILQTKDSASYRDLATQARALSEKLGLLALAEKLETGAQPTIGTAQLVARMKAVAEAGQDAQLLSKTPTEKTPLSEHDLEPKLVAKEEDIYRPTGETVSDNQDDIHEPVIEKIKDIVAAIPPEADEIESLVDAIEPADRFMKNDVLEIGGEYAQTLIFEPVVSKDVQDTPAANEPSSAEDASEKPKSLNDKLKSGVVIGINDRMAFVKQLFNGSDADYNRVLSQVATLGSAEEAKQFIAAMVKPDYNHWEGKEAVEERFMQLIARNFS